MFTFLAILAVSFLLFLKERAAGVFLLSLYITLTLGNIIVGLLEWGIIILNISIFLYIYNKRYPTTLVDVQRKANKMFAKQPVVKNFTSAAIQKIDRLLQNVWIMYIQELLGKLLGNIKFTDTAEKIYSFLYSEIKANTTTTAATTNAVKEE